MYVVFRKVFIFNFISSVLLICVVLDGNAFFDIWKAENLLCINSVIDDIVTTTVVIQIFFRS